MFLEPPHPCIIRLAHASVIPVPGGWSAVSKRLRPSGLRRVVPETTVCPGQLPLNQPVGFAGLLERPAFPRIIRLVHNLRDPGVRMGLPCFRSRSPRLHSAGVTTSVGPNITTSKPLHPVLPPAGARGGLRRSRASGGLQDDGAQDPQAVSDGSGPIPC